MMNILNLIVFGCLSVAMLTGCSKPYDFAGNYRGIEGDCQDVPGERTMFVVSNVPNKDNVYTASLLAKYSAGGTLPTESKEAEISADGSLTLNFVKKGESGFLLNTPAVNMVIKLVPRDSKHIYLEQWPVTMTPLSNPNNTASFDFISDRVINYLGREIGNDFPNQAGSNGLCLQKVL